MKQFITYISMTLLLLTSCADMDEFLSNGTGGTELKIGDVTTQDGIVQSRAVNTAGVLTSGSIGLFLRESGSTASTYDGTTYNDIQYTYSSGAWSAASTAIKLSGTSGSLYAYYPYNSSYTTLTAIPLTSSVNGEDLCYSGAIGVSDVKPAANIGLNHAMALIDLQFSDTWAISKLTITGANVASTGTLDMTTGTVTATGTTGLVSLGSCQATSSSPVRCLIVPASSTAADVTISCLIGGATYSTTLSSVTLTSGAHYTVNMSVTLDHDYVEINGLKWATMNVGATTVAESEATCFGDYYSFGSTDLYYSYISWSDYDGTVTYKSGYSQKSYCTQTIDTSILENNTIKPEYDVAHVNWGGNWRMPTLDDFKSLYTACGITSNYTSNTSATQLTSSTTTITAKGVYWLPGNMTIDGVKYTIRGILFVADDSDTSKRVFFPAGGGFVDSSSSTYDSANYYGQYWTSTYSGSSYLCYSLYINGKVKYWLVTSRASHGYTIRPVWAE